MEDALLVHSVPKGRFLSINLKFCFPLSPGTPPWMAWATPYTAHWISGACSMYLLCLIQDRLPKTEFHKGEDYHSYFVLHN